MVAIKQRKQKNSLNKKNITGKKLLKSKTFVHLSTKKQNVKKNLNGTKSKMNINKITN